MNLKHLYAVLLYVLPAIVLLAACDHDAPEEESPLPEGKGELIVGLQTDGDLSAQDAHFFVFNTTGELVHHEYFDNPDMAALHVSYLVPGTYTAVAVLNAGADFMPPSGRAESSLPDVTLPAFSEWLKTISSKYPGLQTGMGSVEVEQGEVARITITLKSGTGGIPFSTLRLQLTLPQPQLPDYVSDPKSRAAEEGYRVRCILELCQTETDKVIMHRQITPSPQPDGTYLVELEAIPYTYHLRLWTDYARTEAPLADTYYHTESLKNVAIVATPSAADTDAKDAAYHAENVTLPEAGATLAVQMQRPLAKYRLIANDVDAYRTLTEIEPDKYPPLEELVATVQYEGYFPSEFNVTTGKPVNSITGSGFTASLAPVTDTSEEVQLASDWVLTDAEGSFVKLTLSIADRKGREVTRVTGIRADYRQGQLTTLRSDFLTAGRKGGGITIDTDWKDIIVEF